MLDRLAAATRRRWLLPVAAVFAFALALAAVLLARPRATGGDAAAALRAHSGIDVRERWATRGARRLEFTIISGMAELDDGSVWVADGMTRRVIALDASGGNARVAARTGDGPGEVRAPELMARRPGGGVAVLDQGHDALQLFGADGRFERRVPLERQVYNPKGLVVLASDAFVVSGGSPGDEHAIHAFSAEGRAIGSWVAIPPSDDPQESRLIAGGPLAVEGAHLLFSQAAPHRIVRWPLRGGPGAVLASDPALVAPIAGSFRRVEEGRVRPRWWFPQSKALFALSGGRLLNVVTNAEEGYSVWEVYDARRRRIARARLERPYEPHALARDGDVLAAYRDAETDEYVAVRLSVRVR